VYNRGVVVQNEMMYHRGESNGPVAQQRPEGLTLNSLFSGDPADQDGWQVKTDDKVIARYNTDDLRFLVHWNAEVFEDFAELKKNMNGAHNLTYDQVWETFIKDLRARGIEVSVPADPLTDRAFIFTLMSAYDLGAPAIYPAEAPVSALNLSKAA
jgi:hypothetical protein